MLGITSFSSQNNCVNIIPLLQMRKLIQRGEVTSLRQIQDLKLGPRVVELQMFVQKESHMIPFL